MSSFHRAPEGVHRAPEGSRPTPFNHLIIGDGGGDDGAVAVDAGACDASTGLFFAEFCLLAFRLDNRTD